MPSEFEASAAENFSALRTVSVSGPRASCTKPCSSPIGTIRTLQNLVSGRKQVRHTGQISRQLCWHAGFEGLLENAFLIAAPTRKLDIGSARQAWISRTARVDGKTGASACTSV